MSANQPEVLLDSALARSGVGTEPGGVSGRPTRDTLKIRVSIVGIRLGARNGGVELQLSGRRATDEGSPLVVDAGDG